MQGLMQDYPLTVDTILRRALKLYASRPLVTRTVKDLEQTTYEDLGHQIRRTAGALDNLGLARDARVASFAWNTANHLALYYAVPGTGRILHTVNIRYFAEQIVYSMNHAEDEAVFVDRSLLPQLAPLLPRIPSLRHVIVMDDGASAELPGGVPARWLHELLGESDESDIEGRVKDEHTAAALCYTTGTTGNAKGVLYSHRSIWLHSNSGVSASGMAITDADNVMPVVPMFHAMAWGLPYSAVQAGAALTMPGPDLSPGALLDLIEGQRVTFAGGVPTIWMGLLPLLAGRDVSSLRGVLGGGSAVPESLSEAFRAETGLPITQAWGMTETSPLASIATLRAEIKPGSTEDAAARATAGLPVYGVEARIVDTTDEHEVFWDGESAGELQVRGPWVAREYYKLPEADAQFTRDGWLRTGDVASITPDGYIHLLDRTKDLIKSGGEWISSVDLENQIMAHPAVAEAAVIAANHPKWMERPLACVVVKDYASLTKDELLDFLSSRLAKWQLPDDIVFIDEVPKTSVGKFSKKDLRATYSDHLLKQN